VSKTNCIREISTTRYRYPLIGFDLHRVSDPLEFRSRATVRVTFQRDRIAFPHQHVRQQLGKLWRNRRRLVVRVGRFGHKIAHVIQNPEGFVE